VLEVLVADGVVVQLGEQGAGGLEVAAVDPEHALGRPGVAEQPPVPEPLEGGLGLVERFPRLVPASGADPVHAGREAYVGE
jgi:hypothetical protein